ncbi:MAG: PD-(D/E)XK nuclease family protein, partial [Pseudomonadota bacterium]
PAYLVEHDQTGGSGLGREIALLRGTAVHGLLEQPEILQSAEDASKLLSRITPSLPDEMIPEAIAEARRVLQMPEASWIFGHDALSEVSLAIDPPRPGPRMIGRIDRLIDDGQTLTLIDIKTDAQPPAAGAPPPRAYLAQLGAYLSALTQMYPEREILAALLWTAVPRLDRVPASTIVSVYDSLRRSS